MTTVLFLCTGNYYRSRIAEEVFNHLCRQYRIKAAALSRGLGHRWPNPNNPGPISKNALNFLDTMGIEIVSKDRMPQPCTPTDIQAATRIIGMQEAEHRSLLFSKFPDCPSEKIEFWSIGDVGAMDVQEACEQTYAQVQVLVAQCCPFATGGPL